MSRHFLIFCGATASLSTELARLSRRLSPIVIIAPAVAKAERGITEASLNRVLACLVDSMKGSSDFEQPARLSVWAYDPESASEINLLWSTFGSSGWVEFIPINYRNRDVPTRTYIEEQVQSVVSKLHLVSAAIYSNRRRTPFPLPLRNFKSDVTERLKSRWYAQFDVEALRGLIMTTADRFRQLHSSQGNHIDDRKLVFSPAADEACHGKPHPTGENNRAYVAGRFRFGAALYTGFHYDVSAQNGKNLSINLIDSNDLERNVASEKRAYVNIFPNDFILPKMKQGA